MGLQIKPFVWSDYERLAAEDGEKIIDTCKKVFLSAPQNYGTYGRSLWRKMRTFREFKESKDLETVAQKAKINIDGLDKTQLLGTVMKIAVAHLREDPKYYTKLKKVES